MYWMPGDMVMPTSIAKRDAGSGVVVGRREPVTKAAPLTPVWPKGPAKKAPTLARTGGSQPKRALLVPAARAGGIAKRDGLSGLSGISKALDEEERPRPRWAYAVQHAPPPRRWPRRVALAAGVAAAGGTAAEVQHRRHHQVAKAERGWEIKNGKMHPVKGDPQIGRSGDVISGSRAVDDAGRRQQIAAVGLGTAGIGGATFGAAEAGLKHRTRAGLIGGGAAALGAGAALRQRSKSHRAMVLYNHRTGRTYVATDQARFTPPKSHTVTKAARTFDPEERRQRRLGAMAAGSALGGTTLGVSGIRDLRHDTRHLRDSGMKLPPARGKNAPKTVRSANALKRKAESIQWVRSALKRGRGAVVTRHSGGKIGGAAVLLGGSAALMRDRHTRRWK